MDPAFFGDKDRPLYGVYHAPLCQAPTDIAVLICNPILQEYIRSHRALRQLADQLAKAGCHVFRFDYFATGDSAGELDEASLEIWQQNIQQAENELRDLSGVRKISLLGLRFGATLAALHESTNIRQLLLWDPVVNGAEYLQQLAEMHSQMLLDPDRFPEPRQQEANPAATEVLGFSVHESLYNQIKQCDLPGHASFSAKKIHILAQQERNTYRSLYEYLQEKGCAVEFSTAAGNDDWDDLERIEDMLMASEISRKIVELIK